MKSPDLSSYKKKEMMCVDRKEKSMGTAKRNMQDLSTVRRYTCKL